MFIISCLLLGVIISLAACASGQKRVDWIAVDPVFSKTDAKQVEVFKSTKEIKRPWGVIGFIYGEYIPAYNEKEINKEIKKAKKLGLNGYNWVIKNRTFKVMAKELEKKFLEILT